MAEHRNKPLKQRTTGIFERYMENYAYLCSREQEFFDMAEVNLGGFPLHF